MAIRINLELTADNPAEMQRQFADLTALWTPKPTSSSTRGNGSEALEAAAAALEAAAEAKNEEAEAGESLLDDAPRRKPATKKVTEAALRKVLTAHMQQFSEKDTTALVKKHAGVTKIRDIDPSYYAAIVDAAEAELS